MSQGITSRLDFITNLVFPAVQSVNLAVYNQFKPFLLCYC